MKTAALFIKGVSMNEKIHKILHGRGVYELLAVFLSVGLLVYNFIIIPYLNTQIANGIKSNPPSITIEDKVLVDSFRAKPTPKILPNGKYQVAEVVDGKEIKVTYYFSEDKTVTKEVILWGKYNLGGSAKYHFDGSVLMYTDIIGDKYLFPEIGEAVSVRDDNTIILHEESRSTSLIHVK